MTTESTEAVIDREPPDTTAAGDGGITKAMVHLVRCADCDFAVRFTPSATGASFTLVDSDRALGIGDHGRPTCPNGHGEMALADEQLPIEQAIDETAERIRSGPAATRLPFPAPPFNYAGALHEIFQKQQAVAILEAKFNDADDRRKKAKTALDTGHAELSILIATLQEREEDRLHEIARREAAAAAGHPEETNLVRCAWEQAHPDESCPICEDPDGAKQRGCGGTARDSAQHVDAGDRYAQILDSEQLATELKAAGLIVPLDVIRAWTPDEREAVTDWAEVENGLADPPDDGPLPRPAVLGTAHVAAETIQSDAAPGETFQCCRACGARLVTVNTGAGETFEPYAAGTRVGVDCPGAKEPARQIARGKKAKGATA